MCIFCRFEKDCKFHERVKSEIIKWLRQKVESRVVGMELAKLIIFTCTKSNLTSGFLAVFATKI